MQLTAEGLARELGGNKAVRSGKNWNTVCPAHPDQGPSLSVTEKDGRVLFKCHAGCSQTAVIDALKARGLWTEKTERKRFEPQKVAPAGATPPLRVKHPEFGIAKHTWVYRDADGRLVGVVHRFEVNGKKIVVPQVWGRADDGEEQWRWGSFTKPRPLYRGELLKGSPKTRVLLVEGEKTADAAAKLCPEYLVISWPGGGNAIKFADWSGLKDRDVVIWPDADEPGAKVLVLAAELLLAEGAKSVKVVQIPKKLPEGWDLADPIPEWLSVTETLATAKPYQPVSDDAVKELNKKYAYCILGTSTVVLEEFESEDGVRQIRFFGPSAFHEFHRNYRVVQGERTNVQASKIWADSAQRRSYNEVVFKPGRLLNGGRYNLWRGFRHEPNEWGEWSMFRDHLWYNLAKGDQAIFDWVFGWFAQMFQNPMTKPGTSLALRGKMGTGKTIIGQVFGSLIYDHYMLVSDSKHVTGNFNLHLAQCLLLHADEAFWAGDPRNVGKLRDMVTNDVQIIEPKGKDVFKVDNFLRLFVSTNNDWAMPSGFEERRFSTHDMGEGSMQDRSFFAAMMKQLDEGGYGRLLHDLLAFDLTTVNVSVIPKTSALTKQKIYSLEPHVQFWYQCLLDGTFPNMDGWPKWISADRIYNAYVDVCKKANIGRSLFKDIFFIKLVNSGLWLESLFPRSKETEILITDSGDMKSVLKVGNILPSLEICRELFERVINEKIDWPVYDVRSEPGEEDLPF